MVAASDSVNNTLQWSESYLFDPFGNLYRKHLTGGSGQDVQWTVSQSNNQMASSFGYDANGNIGGVNNGNQSYNFGYDPENRIVSAALTSNSAQFANYAYDAQNRRIWSWTGGLDTLNNMINYTVNIYTPHGRKLAAYTLKPWVYSQSGVSYPIIQVTLASSDKYFGSRRLAVMDRLGSAGTYFPWGEASGSTNPLDTWSYGTYWRDSLTAIDYANNRYYSNAYGRFITPDPYQASGGTLEPQSWNRYAYTRGDPVNRLDPQGLRDCETCGDGGGDGPGGDDPGGDDPTGYCPPSIESCAPLPTGGTGSPGSGGTGGSSGSGSAVTLGELENLETMGIVSGLVIGANGVDFSFVGPGVAIAATACALDPVCDAAVVVTGGVVTIYVAYKYLPGLYAAIVQNIYMAASANDRGKTKSFGAAVRAYENKCHSLTEKQVRELHEAITEKRSGGFTFWEIVELAEQMFGCSQEGD